MEKFVYLYPNGSDKYVFQVYYILWLKVIVEAYNSCIKSWRQTGPSLDFQIDVEWRIQLFKKNIDTARTIVVW